MLKTLKMVEQSVIYTQCYTVAMNGHGKLHKKEKLYSKATHNIRTYIHACMRVYIHTYVATYWYYQELESCKGMWNLHCQPNVKSITEYLLYKLFKVIAIWIVCDKTTVAEDFQEPLCPTKSSTSCKGCHWSTLVWRVYHYLTFLLCAIAFHLTQGFTENMLLITLS